MQYALNRRAVGAGLCLSAILPTVALAQRPEPVTEAPIASKLWDRLPLPMTPAEAWQAIPAATRGEIGAALVGMVLADLIGGQAYDEPDQFLDASLREEACGVSDYLLSRIYQQVEVACPEMFGTDDHPAWALDGGLVR